MSLLQTLPPDQLELVKRHLFFTPGRGTGAGTMFVASETPAGSVSSGSSGEVNFNFHIDGGKQRMLPPKSPHLATPGLSGYTSPGIRNGPPVTIKKISHDPPLMNRPMSPASSAILRQALRTVSPLRPPPRKRQNGEVIGFGDKTRDAVVVSSLSLDWEELAKIPGVHIYELRLLWHLFLLKYPDIRVVMCTSNEVSEELIQYYLSYLPGMSAENARKRLLMLSCHDGRSVSVTDKLIQRPRAIERIRQNVKLDKAYMTCFNSTDSEVLLAEKIGVPLLGNGNDAAEWGTKSGNRQIFRDAEIDHPDGSYEAAFDSIALAREILALMKRNPEAKKIMVKLNESFSGEGNAILRVGADLKQKVFGNPDPSAARAIDKEMQDNLEYVANCETWEHYSSQMRKLGCICEVFVEGSSDAKTSPSCQGFVNGDKVQVFATHEQWLDGQIYIGCHFPAKEEYAKDLIPLTFKIGEALARKGVVGYIAADFVSVRQEDGSYKHSAIEVNVRMGGTTLPIMTMDLLCASGRFDLETSQYIGSDGQPRFYTASDTIRKKSYQGLLTWDMRDFVRRHSEQIEWNRRPGAPETGCVFHLVPLLSEMGKCGVVCVGRSREEARELFNLVQRLLDADTKAGHETASVEVDPADRLM